MTAAIKSAVGLYLMFRFSALWGYDLLATECVMAHWRGRLMKWGLW